VDDASGDQQDNLIAFIMGTSSDKGHVTISASSLDRGGLQIGDSYDDFGQSGMSFLDNPVGMLP
jgi:hypothetical protein